MALAAGRGAQNLLGASGSAAARGATSATLEANGAAMLALVNAGTEGDGSTATGATSTGAAPKEYALTTNDSFGYPTFTVANTLTATAGGTQAAALALTAGVNRITVVATAADSVRLPAMVPGQLAIVINSDAADSTQVFGAGTSTINGVATATGVALAAGKTGIYVAVTAGLIYGGALA
jgi:hypothetical protein